MRDASFLRAPLCPAGHLPHEGGDWRFGAPLFPAALQRSRLVKSAVPDISPQVGEMSGRTEGGAVPPACQAFNA
ncbi:MAG: hypothetical protein EOS73_12385 [Mesorhizobium sp.]|nr:hypothetical protein EN749_23565 [Mesorhizobium sp. M7A.F.Ca.ET.027.02.1.1]RWD09077.1 MAG: hypothetical protein EOS73_12385 [Mesorhizobium sp.]